MTKVKKFDGDCFLETFANQPGLIQGFSTREFGNLKARKRLKGNKNLEKFLSKMGIKKSSLVMMEQVHGDKIGMVGKSDQGKVIKGIDGLVTSQKGIFLGVNTADCLPLFFSDPRGKIAGVAHAGWKGVLSRVGQKIVQAMIKTGSHPDEIVVGIGPHIGGCCYTVNQERVERFLDEFGHLPGMMVENGQKVHLDLTVPMIVQLIEAGIKRENIEVSRSCTACDHQQFFSFRKDSQKTYGEMLGVIGWI
jgi:YfiH family protein